MRAEANEERAERYGKSFAAEFEARPVATKSMALSIPTAEVLPSGRIDGRPDEPAPVRDDADLGSEMWPSRPLVVDGFGFKAQRVGHVPLVGVTDDEQLFFLSQLKESDRYTPYLHRLVEQGAIDALPMLGSHHTTRDSSGRITSLPVAGMLLKPAPIAA